MENYSLYNKYRPRKFEDVLNQTVTVDFLIKSLVNKKINHFYIFSGNKGTGKTSTARIFSKALNCNNPTKGCNPCYECEYCLSDLNIIEIDASSNNGVDNIRMLIDKSKQVSIDNKKRVFILDEAHMLTKSAFNAMLKTLEETDNSNVFILATTEMDKIPDTIVSRAINLYFNDIDEKKIKELIKRTAKKENIEISNNSLDIISKASKNAARNALVNLQKAAIYTENNVSGSDVQRLFRLFDKKNLEEIYENIKEGKDKEKTKSTIELSGVDFKLFLESLLDLSLQRKDINFFEMLFDIYKMFLESKNESLFMNILLEYNKQSINKEQENTIPDVPLSLNKIKKRRYPECRLVDILEEATINDRKIWQTRWKNNKKFIKERNYKDIFLSLMNSNVVAASKLGVVLSVRSEIDLNTIIDKYEKIYKLLSYYSGQLETFLILTEDGWIKERNEFLEKKKTKKEKISVTSLFGSDIVEEI